MRLIRIRSKATNKGDGKGDIRLSTKHSVYQGANQRLVLSLKRKVSLIICRRQLKTRCSYQYKVRGTVLKTSAINSLFKVRKLAKLQFTELLILSYFYIKVISNRAQIGYTKASTKLSFNNLNVNNIQSNKQEVINCRYTRFINMHKYHLQWYVCGVEVSS